MTFSKHLFLFFISMIFIVRYSYGQDSIYFANPSFEDLPRHSHTPRGWTDCGFPYESEPDVQPNPIFQVTTKAHDGNTYMALVVRDNETWESAGNKLSAPLKEGVCYQFEIDLARSLTYLSTSRKYNKPANYIIPTKFKLWGGSDVCHQDQLLAETEVIDHSEWKKYSFHIRPESDEIQYIVIEAFYKNFTTDAYNGNLLIDNASAFISIPNCDEFSILHKDTPHQTGTKTFKRPNPASVVRTSNTNNNDPFLQHTQPKGINNNSARTRAVADIDNDNVCQLIDELNINNLDNALSNLALYASYFNTPRWRWTIVVSDDHYRIQKRTVRMLNAKIKELGLKPYLKVITLEQLHTDAEKLCLRPYGTGSAGVYY